MPPPFTVAVVAMSPNRVIGLGGKLPWHLPGDLRFFRRATMGHAVLMGRKTWESIGKPLPGRRNIVLSRSAPDLPPGVDLIHAPGELDALRITTRLCVIGGAEIYRLFLPRCDELLLTWVRQPHAGDTFFPEFEDRFTLAEVLEEAEQFEVRRYVAARAD
ncbi:MAG: dihydrofolate reductase [Verrucomicrobia bacterium]|nr:dihydrofolate reductase [Verrucomicrobiota bacterium]